MNIIDLYDYDFDVMNLARDLNTMHNENKHAFEKQCYMITADALRRMLNNINDLEGDLCHLSEMLKETELGKRKLWHLLNDADIAAFNAASEQEYINWCESIGRSYEEKDARAEEDEWIKEQCWKWNSKSRAAKFARKYNLSREDAEKWHDVAAKNIALCEKVNEKYNREDKRKAFLTKIFETIALAFESWEEYEQLIKADAAKSDTELNVEPDDEELPF